MPTPTTTKTTTTTPTAAALGLLALAMLAHVSVSSAATAAATAHKCFVCSPQSGSSADSLRDMFPGETMPTCDRFHADEGRLARECPPEYRGCLTVTNGTHVTRTCSEHPVDDCKFANGIKYCYCGRPLCNRATDGVQAIAPGPIDDEDLSVAEGSGAGTYRHREPHTTASSSSATPHATPTPTPSHGKSDAVQQRTDVSFAVVMVAALCALV